MSALQRALEAVYSGDQSLEALAVTDKLEDEGRIIVPARPRRRRWWWR